MNCNDHFLRKVYLKPGELVIAEDPVMVSTVLGSCISVTMFNLQGGVSAICHAMLPSGEGRDFKYVDSSLRHMVQWFEEHGITREEIQVKLFGGADMFEAVPTRANNLTVGWQNILIATRQIEEHGLVLAASDTGGKQGRKLIFKSDTGVVFLKRLTGYGQLTCVDSANNFSAKVKIYGR